MKILIGRFFATLFLFLMVFSSLTYLSLYATASDEAFLAIGEANGKLKMAFEAVLEAERAGANVSDLICRLNEGGRLLAEAENAYKAEDFSKAMAMAEECSMLAENVTSQASELRERAIVNAQTIFWHNLALSIFGAATLLVALFFAWGWFKRAYVKRMLDMKPEVSGNVED